MGVVQRFGNPVHAGHGHVSGAMTFVNPPRDLADNSGDLDRIDWHAENSKTPVCAG
jgi:hypothetical protein